MLRRKKHVQPRKVDEVLDLLPARVLLDRMPGPVIGFDHHGIVAYANPAAVALLGFVDGALIGRELPSLLIGRSFNTGEECAAALRAASGGEIVEWHHVDGFSIRTAVSTPLLLRATDPLLMVCITDVTELQWGDSQSAAAVQGSPRNHMDGQGRQVGYWSVLPN